MIIFPDRWHVYSSIQKEEFIAANMLAILMGTPEMQRRDFPQKEMVEKSYQLAREFIRYKS